MSLRKTLYALLLILGALAYLPRILYGVCWQGKYRRSFFNRLGLGWPDLGGKPLVWVHAVSLGEMRAVAPLAKMLAAQHPAMGLVISTVTETGYGAARELIPEAQAHLFFPLDLPWLWRRLLKNTQLKGVILAEGDLWWGFLAAAKEKGAFVAIVNGKMSERSLRRWRYCPWLRRELASHIDLCLIQNDSYLKRFRLYGIPRERIHIAGNLKFDGAPKVAALPPPLLEYPYPLLVLGSTHYPEEKELLKALLPLWNLSPSLLVAVAPRHPHRYNEVGRLLDQIGLPWQRLSTLGLEAPLPAVLLIDTMGLLPALYLRAILAIVGGSFTPEVGGHNIMEPCLVGTPVLFGPYMQAQEEMVALVAAYRCGAQLKSAEELTSLVKEWLGDKSRLLELREGCAALKASVGGAIARSYAYLSPLITKDEG